MYKQIINDIKHINLDVLESRGRLKKEDKIRMRGKNEESKGREVQVQTKLAKWDSHGLQILRKISTHNINIALPNTDLWMQIVEQVTNK
ncbi:hypothetical protein SESBI_36660 [Sesbania bispinosa]|nr:hypothetical protein SESBI_36660 [Sesbania bispinosa]